MFNTFNISLALESVKKIYDSNQCTVCDRTEGKFKRYLCGHSACESCSSGTDNCFFCLTPPDQSTSKDAEFDDVLTQRAINASELLKTFERAFNVDVLKHQRISRHLKLEKEIFPECIQAPIKYCNKRKSLNPQVRKKCNKLSKLPGENIYPGTTTKMEKSINSVEQWFNKIKESSIKGQKVNNKDDSGIVTDDSVIDCSQIIEDKDQNALLAVYEADKKELNSGSSHMIESDNWSEFHDNELTLEHPKIIKEIYKVPFLKKSKLSETIASCDMYTTHSNMFTMSTNVSENTKNIQITIFNHNQSIRCNDVSHKVAVNSVPAQTDICEISQLKPHTAYVNKRVLSENKSLNVELCSQDVFTPEEICSNTIVNYSNNDTKTVPQTIVIEETDNENNSFAEEELVEEINRSQTPVIHDVLRSFDSHKDFLNRPRRRPRGLTPDSSNSSDKENINPNRAKRARHGKKNKKK